MGKNRGIVQSSKEEHRQLVRAEKQKAQFEEQTRYQRYQVKGNYLVSFDLTPLNFGPLNFGPFNFRTPLYYSPPLSLFHACQVELLDTLNFGPPLYKRGPKLKLLSFFENFNFVR